MPGEPERKARDVPGKPQHVCLLWNVTNRITFQVSPSKKSSGSWGGPRHFPWGLTPMEVRPIENFCTSSFASPKFGKARICGRRTHQPCGVRGAAHIIVTSAVPRDWCVRRGGRRNGLGVGLLETESSSTMVTPNELRPFSSDSVHS